MLNYNTKLSEDEEEKRKNVYKYLSNRINARNNNIQNNNSFSDALYDSTISSDTDRKKEINRMLIKRVNKINPSNSTFNTQISNDFLATNKKENEPISEPINEPIKNEIEQKNNVTEPTKQKEEITQKEMTEEQKEEINKIIKEKGMPQQTVTDIQGNYRDETFKGNSLKNANLVETKDIKLETPELPLLNEKDSNWLTKGALWFKDLVVSTVTNIFNTIDGLKTSIVEGYKERKEMVDNMTDKEKENLQKQLDNSPMPSLPSTFNIFGKDNKLIIEDVIQDFAQNQAKSIINDANNVANFATIGAIEKGSFTKELEDADLSVLQNSQKYGDYSSQEELTNRIQKNRKEAYEFTDSYNPSANKLSEIVTTIGESYLLRKAGLSSTASVVLPSAINTYGQTGNVQDATSSAVQSYIFSKVLNSTILNGKSTSLAVNGSNVQGTLKEIGIKGVLSDKALKTTSQIIKNNPELFNTDVKKAILNGVGQGTATFITTGGSQALAGEINAIMQDGTDFANGNVQKDILLNAIIWGAGSAGLSGYNYYKIETSKSTMNYTDTQDQLKRIYNELELDPNKTYTQEEIHKQYRNLAKKYHTDITGDNDKMSSINQAVDTLNEYFKTGKMTKAEVKVTPTNEKTTSTTSSTDLVNVVNDNTAYINTKGIINEWAKSIVNSNAIDTAIPIIENNDVIGFEQKSAVPFEVQNSNFQDINPAIIVNDNSNIDIIDLSTGVKLLTDETDVTEAVNKTRNYLQNPSVEQQQTILNKLNQVKYSSVQAIKKMKTIIDEKMQPFIDVNNNISQIKNNTIYSKGEAYEIFKYVADNIDGIDIIEKSGKTYINASDNSGSTITVQPINNKKEYTGLEVKKIISNALYNTDLSDNKAIENNTQNLQQNNTIIQNNISDQQVNSTENKIAQNGFSEQINSNNISTENKSFEDVVSDAMQNSDTTEIESPLQSRNIETIGKQKNVNAYQYDNPQVKPYFQEMAQMIGEDLSYISSSDNRSTKKGGGTKLSTTTKAISTLHDELGYSYDQIAKGLQNIIDDDGKENNAISKKIELIIDEQLRNGYTNALGKSVEANQEYINTIANSADTRKKLNVNFTGNSALSFEEQVDKWKNGEFNKRNSHLVVMRETPKLYQDLGLDNLPITIVANKLERIYYDSGKQKGEYHGLFENVKKIPYAIENPLNIVESTSNPNSIIIITDLADNNGNIIMLSLELNGNGQIEIDNVDKNINANVLTSAYGRKNYDRQKKSINGDFKGWMQQNFENGRIIYDIDEGIIKRPIKGQRLQLPNSNNTSSINNSIPQKTKNVKSDKTAINKDMQNIEKNTNIQDFGEKIGGARKDTAIPRGTTKSTKEVIHDYTVKDTENGYSVDFKGKTLQDGFKTQKEAEEYILAFKDTVKSNLAFVEELINGRTGEKIYRIRLRNPRTLRATYTNKSFSNKQDAESYAIALSMYLKENGKNLFRPQIQKVSRINVESKNATKTTGENILKDFGFKGGEFGNWVTQSERQQFLNYAQDAFIDLATALDVLPSDLGQNGDMSIAFGARGKGLTGAVAHFEPAKKVINMTRLKGAGSLAHEYGHSIDNWLSRIAGYNKDGMVTEDALSRGRLSQNLRKAVNDVTDAMNYSISTNQEEVDKKNAIYEKNRKESLEYNLRHLDKVFKGEATKYKRVKGKYESVPIEVTEKQKSDYQKIRNTLMNGDIQGDIDYKLSGQTLKTEKTYPEPINKLQQMYKEVVGRKLDDDTVYSLYRQGKPARQITEVKSESAYRKSAIELDKMMGRQSTYHSRTDEMWARAFEAYVSDKLKAKGITDTYLVHSVNNSDYALFNPYPAGEERQNINKAFDNLIQTMKDEGILHDNKNNKVINEKDTSNNAIRSLKKSNNQNKLAKQGNIMYNSDGITLNRKEYANVMSLINTNNVNSDSLDSIFSANYFYIYKNNGFNENKVIAKIKIDGNENLISLLREEIKNGIDQGTKTINNTIQAIRNVRKFNNSNNVINKGKGENGEANRLYYRDERQKNTNNKGERSKESVRNRSGITNNTNNNIKSLKKDSENMKKPPRNKGIKQENENNGLQLNEDATIKIPENEKAQETEQNKISKSETNKDIITEEERQKLINKSKTNGERDDAYIEQAMQEVFRKGEWDENINPISPSNIVDFINDYFQEQIEKGHFRQNAYGIYKEDRDIIRVESLDDIDTIMHEMFHRLFKYYNMNEFIDKMYEEVVTDEVFESYQNLRNDEDALVNEGFAEFGRRYMVQKQWVEKNMPKTVELFNERRKENPELDKFINDLQSKIHDYIYQEPSKRRQAKVSTAPKEEQQSLKESMKSAKYNLQKMLLNKDYPIEFASDYFVKGLGYVNSYELPDISNPIIQNATKSGINDTIDSIVKDGFYDLDTGEKLCDGIAEIGKIFPNTQEYLDFVTYLVALRDKEIAEKGKKSGARYDDVIYTINKFAKNDKFQKAKDIYQKFSNTFLDQVVKSGLYSKEQAQAMRDTWENYAPFLRVMDKEHKGGSGLKNPIKRFKGSERDVINPIEGLIIMMGRTYPAMNRNLTIKKLVDLGEMAQLGGEFYDIIPVPVKHIATEHLSDFKKELEKQGVDTDKIDLEKTYELFYPDYRNNQNEQITSYKVNGKDVTIQFRKNEIGKDLYKIFAGNYSPDVPNIIEKVFRSISTVFRYGTTILNPAFVINNISSDTQQAAINAKGNFIPFVDSYKGVIDVLIAKGMSNDLYNKLPQDIKDKIDNAPHEYKDRIKKMYALYKQSGASGSSKTKLYTNRNLSSRYTADIMRNNYKTLGLRKNHLKSAIDKASFLSELSEESTRFEVFIKDMEKELKNGKDFREALTSSMYNTKNATQDFSTSGSLIANWSPYVPYISAKVGSLENAKILNKQLFGEANREYKKEYNNSVFKDGVDEAKKKATKRAAKVFAKKIFMTAFFAGIGFLIRKIYKDNASYDEINEQKKNNNYYINVGDKWLKIKKPQGEARVWVNLGEYFSDLTSGNVKNPAKEFLEIFKNQVKDIGVDVSSYSIPRSNIII